MNKGSLYNLYWKLLTDYCRHCSVPDEVIPEISEELHEGFKNAFSITSISGGRITKHELWEYVQKVQMLLSRDYGFSLDMHEELKL